MLRSVNSLKGFRILASDGEIGKVLDFFFEDRSGTIRYAVVDTALLFAGRSVLISPTAFGQPDWINKQFPVRLTKEKIRNSPDVSADKPVSLQEEEELSSYFKWPRYWTDWSYLSPHPPFTGNPFPPKSKEVPVEEAEHHLRSVREVEGYDIQAEDGHIGHLEDFIVEDLEWKIRYFVIDTRNWLPGRKVLLAIDWIKKIRWDEKDVEVGMTRESIKHSPEYDPNKPVNREYEQQLYDYYGRPVYWD